MKTAVVYWSGTGNTEAMAKAVAEGMTAAGAEAVLLTPDKVQPGDLNAYDAIAFGCPAMGSEVLEEMEFQPMFDACKRSLGGKRAALFGSYGWGDGELGEGLRRRGTEPRVRERHLLRRARRCGARGLPRARQGAGEVRKRQWTARAKGFGASCRSLC